MLEVSGLKTIDITADVCNKLFATSWVSRAQIAHVAFCLKTLLIFKLFDFCLF